MAAYSGEEDLLIGDLRVNPRFDLEKVLLDVGEEIDAAIGYIYVTPIDMTEAGPVARHSRLLLKKISNYLASGRIILALAIGGEDTTLNAYGLSLVNEAKRDLSGVASGTTVLVGATLQDTTDTRSTGPIIRNEDEFSGVQTFYDEVMRVPSILSSTRVSPAWAPGPGGTN